MSEEAKPLWKSLFLRSDLEIQHLRGRLGWDKDGPDDLEKDLYFVAPFGRDTTALHMFQLLTPGRYHERYEKVRSTDDPNFNWEIVTLKEGIIYE